MTMSETVISLKGIEKSYGKHKVLSNVNLDIQKGDIFGLVGKNGAGKTTIFKLILGLSEYSKGTIELNGSGTDLDKGREKMGFFIGSDFFGYLSGRRNLEYYRRMKGIRDKKEVDRVLEIVGLENAKGPVSRYSMGMKQRLGIANAIMGNPEILILDEPTNGLDPQGIAGIRELIQKLNRDYGMTIVVSSHILGELQHTAHRFGIVNGGSVLKTITQEDLVLEQKAVRISVDDLERAKAVLEEAGIHILSEERETRTLEDFYFSVVEGEKHD